AVATLAYSGGAEARDQIRIVGSSTVYPFSTAVAEQFGNKSSFPTPVVESTGSGGGLKLFCAGVGEEHPDITNASRRIKQSEVDDCAANGIPEITEVKVGFDGIVLANSKEADPIDISLAQIWLALAKDVPVDGSLQPNPYQNWSEIDPSLPDVKIEVLGPPPTSGTRDAFVELAMEGGCEGFDEVKALEGDAHTIACHTIREDGAFVEAGENDNLIVNKLQANPDAFGVFGFSFLDQNLDVLQGSAVGGVEPTFDDIADGAYPISRSLYFYVKNPHVDVIPGLKEYVEEFTSDAASGEDGYLSDKGLIPLADGDRTAVRDQAVSFTPLTM
ncbi:MAG: substrate-binding domain-containing protein, partial [Pseudomonadota bacterium]